MLALTTISDKEDVDDGQHVDTISDVESVEDVQTFKTVSDEEDVDDGENVNLQPTEDQYSPEFLLCAAGNLEHVAKQVVNLETRLRQAPFLDVDACLSEIISSCKSIVDSVQHVQKIAEKYTLQRSNDNGSFNQIHIFEDPSTQRDPGKRPIILSDANKRYLINLGPCQPKLDTFPKNLTSESQYKIGFRHHGKESIRSWSIASRTTLLIVLCVLYFHLALIVPKRKMPG